MWQDVTEVEVKENHRLLLRFEIGQSGIVNVAEMIEFSGVFTPLQERAFFEQVRVDPDLGTIVWPNGADLDPIVLYAHATGQPLPEINSVDLRAD